MAAQKIEFPFSTPFRPWWLCLLLIALLVWCWTVVMTWLIYEMNLFLGGRAWWLDEPVPGYEQRAHITFWCMFAFFCVVIAAWFVCSLFDTCYVKGGSLYVRSFAYNLLARKKALRVDDMRALEYCLWPVLFFRVPALVVHYTRNRRARRLVLFLDDDTALVALLRQLNPAIALV